MEKQGQKDEKRSSTTTTGTSKKAAYGIKSGSKNTAKGGKDDDSKVSSRTSGSDMKDSGKSR